MKIKDIFDGEGITESHSIKSNLDGMNQTIEIAKKDFNGLCFVNLVDFDALYGHRRDPPVRRRLAGQGRTGAEGKGSACKAS